MIMTTDILDAINLRLIDKWPDRTVYVEACPVDFDRPSFWLQVQSHDTVDAGRFIQRHTAVFMLNLHDEPDEHYEAHWQRLSRETDEAMELLTVPLKVGERVLRMNLKRLPRDPDRAQIQISVVWMDEMPGINIEDAPVADSYELVVRGDIK